MTPAPKDAPERDLYDELTDGKGPCNQHMPDVTPPKDTPVEPDFAAEARRTKNTCIAKRGSGHDGACATCIEEALRAAFAASRHLSCEASAKQEAAPQPEGGRTARAEQELAKLVQFFNEPAGYSRFGFHGDEHGLSEADSAVKGLRDCITAEARIAALEAALREAVEQVRWFLSVYSDSPTDFPITRAALERIAALTPTSSAADGKGEEG